MGTTLLARQRPKENLGMTCLKRAPKKLAGYLTMVLTRQQRKTLRKKCFLRHQRRLVILNVFVICRTVFQWKNLCNIAVGLTRNWAAVFTSSSITCKTVL